MKSIMITGASRGIGRAIALEFASTPPNVFFTTYNKNSEEMIKVHKILSMNNTNFSFQMDVTKRKQIEQGIKYFKDYDTQFGIDVLVNNAGIVKDRTLAKMSNKEWDDVIAVNLTGIFNVTKAILPYMKQGGSIINVTSIIGLIGGFGQCNYAASKAGVIGFTKSLAKELAPKNIRVNAIACGYVKTDMTKNIPDERMHKILDSIPMERMAFPEEIAKTVRFISNASYLTGKVITVDGGLT